MNTVYIFTILVASKRQTTLIPEYGQSNTPYYLGKPATTTCHKRVTS